MAAHLAITPVVASQGRPSPKYRIRMVNKMAQFQLGSVSTGTLRTEDLIPAFMSALDRLGKELPGDLECLSRLEYIDVTTIPQIADNVSVIDDDDDYWNSEEAGWDMESLTQALEECCPPFVYFGAIEGDGADFGFWPDTYSLGDALQDTWDGESSSWDWNLGYYTLVDPAVIVQVSDHGNVTVMDMERNVLWSVV